MTGDNTRASDQERQAVVDRLSVACREGLLTLEEFSDRAGEAYAATTRGDLDNVLRDLRLPVIADGQPLPGSGARATSDSSRGRRWIVALFGTDHRRGRWRAEPRLRTVAIMGGARVDLRDAVIEGDDIEILACSLMGSVHVIVPPGIPVEVVGFTIMGSRRNDVASLNAMTGGPRVLVRGYGLFGTVKVDSDRLDVSRG